MADWIDTKYSSTWLAHAEDDCGYENVSLCEVSFDCFPVDRMFVVRYGNIDGQRTWSHVFSDLRSAMADFGKEARRKYKTTGGSEGFVYKKPEWTEEWKYYAESLIPDYRWSDEKDYGPSNPWDAPGMKISDFIRGVY